jgi:peptide/nickel transport system permease protein
MWSFVARRVASALLTFVGITLATFLLIHAVPGDPIAFYVGRSGFHASDAALSAIRAEHHLDKPMATQYGWWARNAVTLDFGRSIIDRQPVSARIWSKLPNTFALNLAAFALAVLCGLPLGLWSALRSGRRREQLTSVAIYLLAALPTFWVALLLMQLFSVRLEWLPLYGMGESAVERLRHMVLPALALTVSQIAIYARFSRSAFAEVLQQDYMTTARAKGLPSRIVAWRHGFRNALIPLITLFGLSVPYLLSGSVIVEQIFQWDGVGHLFVESILARDYPVVMGLTVITALATLAASVMTDLLYLAADPRLRTGDDR